jgi:RNA polymerase sigma-70 factor (ECF subfamily)
VRARLLVGDGPTPPGIAQYAGIGSLEGWLRVAAVRTALNAIRGAKREVRARESLLAAVGEPITEPELALVKVRYRGALEQATVKAFEQLPADQRELLRLYVVDGLTLEELSRIHDVHTATVSRWLTRIRDKIAADARRYFASECHLPPSECDSLLRVVQSEMHVSVARLLGGAA